MKKLSREKIALIIFALLVVCGFGALMFYITNIGHSFNVTASTIDDAAGDLGDYTAIIYEGTAEEKKALGEAGLERIAEDGSNKTLELGKDQQVDDAAAGDEVVVSDVVPKSTADGQGSTEEPKKPGSHFRPCAILSCRRTLRSMCSTFPILRAISMRPS